jgi:hypothetical protein
MDEEFHQSFCLYHKESKERHNEWPKRNPQESFVAKMKLDFETSKRILSTATAALTDKKNLMGIGVAGFISCILELFISFQECRSS